MPASPRTLVLFPILLILETAAQLVHGQCTYGWELSQELSGLESEVLALASWDPDGAGPSRPLLAAGGIFRDYGPYVGNYVAIWDGTRWDSAAGGMNHSVDVMTVYRGQLIAGGTFTIAGGIPANHVAAWNGTQWEPLGPGLNRTTTGLAVYHDELIATGFFDSSGGVPMTRIARWDGIDWKQVPNPFVFGNITCFTVFEGDLILGGNFIGSGNIFAIARWNGQTWSPIGGRFNGSVDSLGVYNGALYAGGTFGVIGETQCNRIARWDGSTWHPVEYGVGGLGTPNRVKGLMEYRGRLTAVGSFTVAGAITVNRVVQWDGTIWHPVGDGVDNLVTSVTEYEGDLIVGGLFAHAGTVPANYIARWGMTSPKPVMLQGPSSPSICEHGAVTLLCMAAGQGNLGYQWRKDGVAIADVPGVLGTQTDRLVFVDANVADTGNYDCVVTLDGCGSATSHWANLNVLAGGSADLNDDGLVDGRDISEFVRSVVDHSPVSEALCAADLSGEGIVDEGDVMLFVGRLVAD